MSRPHLFLLSSYCFGNYVWFWSTRGRLQSPVLSATTEYNLTIGDHWRLFTRVQPVRLYFFSYDRNFRRSWYLNKQSRYSRTFEFNHFLALKFKNFASTVDTENLIAPHFVFPFRQRRTIWPILLPPTILVSAAM